MFVLVMKQQAAGLHLKHFTGGINTVTSQQEGPGFQPPWGQGVWVLHILPVSAWALYGSSGFLPHSITFGE